MGGTVLASQLALKYGIATNIGGGTHHAFRDYGSGFTIFNDLAISAMSLIKKNKIDRVMIIDLDVHQGDGTASIFENDPRVFTFSAHCKQNFPFKK